VVRIHSPTNLVQSKGDRSETNSACTPEFRRCDFRLEDHAKRGCSVIER
jgi:hypothetical protein